GAEPAVTAAGLLGETLIGFAIGLGAAAVVGAAEVAGELMTTQVGLSGAALLDPLSNQSVPVLGQLMQLFAVALLLAFDAHLAMIDAVAASLRYIPVGSPVDFRGGMGAMVSLGSTLFSLGLRFAAPVLAAVLIANVALAVLSRVAPSLNVLSVAFPIQIGLGLFTLAAALPLVAAWFTGWGAAYEGTLDHLLGALRGAGGR
ncbi:MAG TPA: flagellar biosynthetic protein FliR, partial [Longimicrobiaceae bacterium]